MLALAAASLAAARSSAQPLGQHGDVSFAADRLMGLYFHDEGGSVTLFGLGGPPPASAPYTTPRLAFDFFVVDHLSVGGAMAYGLADPEGRRNSFDGILLAPRVGYAIDIGDSFGFWPRGGFTFRDFEGNDELALTFEGAFWAAPTQHFAFLFGPALDLGLVGDGDEARSFGVVSAGLLGWL